MIHDDSCHYGLLLVSYKALVRWWETQSLRMQLPSRAFAGGTRAAAASGMQLAWSQHSHCLGLGKSPVSTGPGLPGSIHYWYHEQ